MLRHAGSQVGAVDALALAAGQQGAVVADGRQPGGVLCRALLASWRVCDS